MYYSRTSAAALDVAFVLLKSSFTKQEEIPASKARNTSIPIQPNGDYSANGPPARVRTTAQTIPIEIMKPLAKAGLIG